MGYKFQFITLAGFHALNHSMFDLARGYAADGMTAYVDAAGARVRRRGRRLHRRPSTSARSAPATSTWSAPRSTRRAPPPRCAAPPRRSSSRWRAIMTRHRDPRRPTPRHDEILTPEALDFVVALRPPSSPARRVELLERRRPAPARLAPRRRDARLPAARPRRIRDDPTWRVAPPAPGLIDRRVEITGPPERKMTINALNSGAKVWMADFEDATVADLGQRRRRPAQPARRASTGGIDFTTGRGQAVPRSATTSATIMVRPRGWHLAEKHLRRSTAARCSAALVDFGLYLFHCAQRQLDARQRPVLLPARSWRATSRPGCGTTCSATPRSCSASRAARSGPPCSSRRSPRRSRWRRSSTSCASTAPGLNAGRWDYIFSIIKTFGRRPGLRAARPRPGDHDGAVHAGVHRPAGAHLPPARRPRDRRHGRVHPQPRRRRPTSARFAQVRVDKEREAGDGFDGSWVAHPALVPVCREVFDRRARRAAAPDRPAARRRRRSPPPTCSTVASAGARGHRGGRAHQHRGRAAVPATPGSAAAARSPSTT